MVVSYGLNMHAHCLGVTVAKAGKASFQYSTTPSGAGAIAIVAHEMGLHGACRRQNAGAGPPSRHLCEKVASDQ